MKLKLSAEGQLRRSIHTLVATGLAATAAGTTGTAFAQDDEAVQLDKVEVTGTRIRRVDIETASPVFVIDRSAIESSGVATLGQLLQEMPTIAGAATNPSVNNGGGTGISTVSLRGLGSERTLVLLNGRRMGFAPQFDAVDVNSIPINMIERVEVLKDGASAIYGSDAIGGVVNFITRKDFSGSEIMASFGQSTRDDAGRDNLWATFGLPSKRGTVLAGLSYDQRDSVSSADRPFSREPFALYNGEQISFGSSRVPNGRYVVSYDTANSGGADLSNPDCGIDAGSPPATVALIRREGTNGSQVSDFRCFVNGGPNNDTFNFQADNVVLTPQERYSAFLTGSWDVLDSFGPISDVRFFAEGLYNNSVASFQIAPEPFDGRPSQANVVFSADSVYNPFGEDITDLRLRLRRVGNRSEQFETDSLRLATGLNGTFLDSWFWDLSVVHIQNRQTSQAHGELYLTALQSAVGPSFDAADNDPNADADGDGDPIDDPRCGTVDNEIAGCTPIDFFREFDPTDANQRAALDRIAPYFHDRHHTELDQYAFNITGDLMQLPAGPLGVAFGVEYREEAADSDPDFLRTQGLNSGGMSAPVSGEFDVTEFYAEAAVPIIADMPLINMLEASVGVRYSDYSTFGETTNAKIGLQWRPAENMLVRATYADVFRAPTITDLFGGANESAESFQDPCNGISEAVGTNANHDAACQNVARDGSYQQTDSQLNALVGSNPLLQPEEGDVMTAGFVWSAPFGHEPLTVEIDAWNVTLSDTIGEVGTQVRLDQCYNFGQFCNSFTRDANGEIFLLNDLTENVGKLDAEGVDVGLRYNFGDTPVGRVSWNIDATWLHTWDNERIEGDPTTLVENVGRFNDDASGGDGNFARWRGLSQINWGLEQWSANWSTRYIAQVTENPQDFGDPDNPDFVANRTVGSQFIHDVQVSYAFNNGVNLSLGIDNVTDKLAPLLYSGFNGTTDVRTYDGVGQFFWLRAKVRFN